MGNKKVKAISTGAMIAALYGVLFFFDLYFGNIIGYYLYFILPSLLIYYMTLYGFMQTCYVGIAAVMVTLFTGSPLSLFYSISSVLIGLIIGTVHTQKKVSGNTMLLLSIGFSLLINILQYTLLSKLFGNDVIAEMKETYEVFSTYFVNDVQFSLDEFIQYAPLLILLYGAIEGYLLQMCNSLILPRLKVPFQYKINVLEMQLPRWAAVLAVGSYLAYYYVPNIYLNFARLFFAFLMMLQGFSYIGLYLVLNKKLILYFLLFIGFFIPFFWKIYFIIGIADIIIGLKSKLMYNMYQSKRGD